MSLVIQMLQLVPAAVLGQYALAIWNVTMPNSSLNLLQERARINPSQILHVLVPQVRRLLEFLKHEPDGRDGKQGRAMGN